MKRNQGVESIGRTGTGVTLRVGSTDETHHQVSVQN